MKKIVFLLGAALLTNFAIADTYKTTFSAPSNNGAMPWNTGMIVDLKFAEDGAITGEMKNMFNVANCRWQGIPITGGNFKDGNFRWASDLHPTKGCGRIVFIGKRVGDKMVGFLPSFQGAKIDIEWEKN